MDRIDSFDVEHRFLSNFWPVLVWFEHILFPSVEHAYVAAKTLDLELRKKIQKLETPGKAKRAGQLLAVRHDWTNEKRLEVMTILLEQKFSHKNPELVKKLLATGKAELIEGNTWGDTFFGICDGVGKNHLGRLLMERRKVLQLEEMFSSVE